MNFDDINNLIKTQKCKNLRNEKCYEEIILYDNTLKMFIFLLVLSFFMDYYSE